MKKLLFILFLLISGATFSQPYTYHLRYDSVKFVTANNSEFILKSSTRDSTNGILLNIGGGITQFKRIRAISATQFTVGTDTITITGSGGGGGGTYTEGYGIDITSNVVSADTAILGPLWRSQISTPNLIIQNAGTGQQSWWTSGDTLYQKRRGNTYGFNWTTSADSTLNGTVDSTIWVPKTTTSQITGLKTFTQDITIQRNGLASYLVINRMGATTGEALGGVQYSDNSVVKMYSFAGNFGDTGWTVMHGNGVATKSLKIENKFGHMSLGHSTFTRGWAIDINHASGNYGADSSLINGFVRYRWINAGSNLVDSFKIDRGANLTTSGFIIAEIDSTGTGTAVNMVYQGVDKKLYRAAVPAGGGSSYTFSSGVFESAGAVKVDTALLTTRAWHQKTTDSVVALIVGGGGISASQVKDYVRPGMYNINLALGSTIKYSTFGRDLSDVTTVAAMTDAQARFMAVYITESTTITGVKWVQSTNGNYTGDAYNGVGLYSYSGGTITLVASSTNDAAIWQQGTGVQSKAFSSTYAASPGVYFVGYLYNNSAQTTAPVIGGYLTTIGIASNGDYTNSAKSISFLGSQTALPSPQAMSGLSTTTVPVFFGLY